MFRAHFITQYFGNFIPNYTFYLCDWLFLLIDQSWLYFSSPYVSFLLWNLSVSTFGYEDLLHLWQVHPRFLKYPFKASLFEFVYGNSLQLSMVFVNIDWCLDYRKRRFQNNKIGSSHNFYTCSNYPSMFWVIILLRYLCCMTIYMLSCMGKGLIRLGY